jgi:hypothetical protein
MAKKATKKTSKKAKASKKANVKKPTKQFINPTYTIDDEFQSLLTPLTREESEALKASLIADGLREPLVVWKEKGKAKGTLVDGHHRHEICMNHPIKKYRTIEKSFDDKDEVKLWIWDNQAGRRNMTKFQRIESVLKIKDIIAEQAKRNQRAGGGSGSSKLNKPTTEPIDTYEILAKKAGVSPNTVRNAEAILNKAAKGKRSGIRPKVLDALRKGTVSINKIYNKYCDGQSKRAKRQDKDIKGRTDDVFKLLKLYLGRVFSQTDDRTHISQLLSEQLAAWANEKQD